MSIGQLCKESKTRFDLLIQVTVSHCRFDEFSISPFFFFCGRSLVCIPAWSLTLSRFRKTSESTEHETSRRDLTVDLRDQEERSGSVKEKDGRGYAAEGQKTS